MQQLLQNFGVNWKLLFAQMINFGILFWLLRRFAYRPILGMLEKRENIIKKGLENAAAAETELKNVQKDAAEIRHEAKKDAHALMTEAHGEVKDLMEEAKKEALDLKNEIIASAEKEIEAQKKAEESILLKKAAEHVASGIRAILKEEITEDINNRLVDRITK